MSEVESKYFENRVKTLEKRLNEENLNCAIFFKDQNIFYLTGFFAKNSGNVLVFTPEKLYLIVHFIYYQEAKKTVKLKNIEILTYTSNKIKIFNDLIFSINYDIFGIESTALNYNEYLKIKNQLKKIKKKVKNLKYFVENQRVVKDSLEISNIKKACEITENALMKVFNFSLKNFFEFTEIELAFFIENLMIKNNSSRKSFDLIVANNENSSLPHFFPSLKKISEGLLLFDVGCIYNNYCSDITRTIFLGNNLDKTIALKIDKLKKIYEVVLQAQVSAINECRAGITAAKLDKTARKIIEKFGYGDFFGHGLGHGVGIEVHEKPTISVNSNEILLENMVVTIEPGVYIEGIGGVRIEDMVIINEKGCQILYSLPKTILVIK